MKKLGKFNRLGYYLIKPFFSRRIQLHFRRKRCRALWPEHAGTWPIDPSSSVKPPGWSGWPEGKQFALVLTHDVESARGQKKCLDLMALEQRLGFRSSFNFVARGYKDRPNIRERLRDNGFEVGVHGLHHTGLMYVTETVFRAHCYFINKYIKKWDAVGFRSPSMHHNLAWTHYLNVQYDGSTFDTDPFEPQPDGVRSIFPFWMDGNSQSGGHVEMPYTLPQDFTLFVLLQQKSIDIWKQKLDWIASQGGMALVLTHPDYMNWDSQQLEIDEYPVDYYAQLLQYIRDKYSDAFWPALPRDVASFWASNYGL